MDETMSEDLHVIVGLGVTAISCARHLTQRKLSFAIVDTRPNPPNLAHFQQAYPEVPTLLGKLDDHFFDKASRLIVSPGISIK
jgi:UDP-N-acetylmuramoylalanine--D-glutamate ligase